LRWLGRYLALIAAASIASALIVVGQVPASAGTNDWSPADCNPPVTDYSRDGACTGDSPPLECTYGPQGYICIASDPNRSLACGNSFTFGMYGCLCQKDLQLQSSCMVVPIPGSPVYTCGLAGTYAQAARPHTQEYSAIDVISTGSISFSCTGASSAGYASACTDFTPDPTGALLDQPEYSDVSCESYTFEAPVVGSPKLAGGGPFGPTDFYTEDCSEYGWLHLSGYWTSVAGQTATAGPDYTNQAASVNPGPACRARLPGSP
jgi:hypothetical protein